MGMLRSRLYRWNLSSRIGQGQADVEQVDLELADLVVVGLKPVDLAPFQ